MVLSSGPSRRMAAAVLQMASLAGSCVEQRPKPVGCLGRRRRGNPKLAKQSIANPEIQLSFEADVP